MTRRLRFPFASTAPAAAGVLTSATLVAVLAVAGLAVSSSAPALAEEGKDAAAKPKVEIRTNVGKVVVELWPDKAPKTVENFLAYSKSNFYAGTIFHRVIKGFMIQGGGFSEDLQRKPTEAPIRLEARAPNERYTIAMARTNDPNSATSQFFINVADNEFLNPGAQGPGYTVFGKVVEGQAVVDQIAGVPTTSKGPAFQNLPTAPVVIESVTVVE